MSDSSPSLSGGSTDLPPATIYDPAEDHDTPFGSDRTGTVVLLLVGQVDRWWAAETAIELSSAWAGNGRRVVLADLFLESPILHEVAGIENLEGMVDVFLYGASISRSARAIEGRSFYLIPAGTYTTDDEAIYRHGRWPKLVAGFKDADASLVLFVPADAPELAAMASWTTEIILLGAPADPSVLSPLLQSGAKLRGLIEPPHGAARQRTETAPLAAAGAAVVEETVAVDDDAGDELDPPATFDPPAKAALHLPPPPVRTSRGSPRALNIALGIIIPLVILAAAFYVVASVRPDLLPSWARIAMPVASEPAVTPPRVIAPLPTPRREGESLPFSVAVISFRSFDDAQRRLTSLLERKDGVLYFVSPEEIQGILYYKVLAGALPDSTAARELKESLVRAKVITAEDAADEGALIQPTPYAFGLGERPTDQAGTAAADSFAARGVPAYGVAVPYSDGNRRWQIYGGAYADSATAEGMRKLLASAGIQPDLIPRIGVRANPAE
jgi:hypothetical protein